jgi:Na+-driven multidrug efflux pump
VQAAFGLVTVTCGMGTTVFNFLVDGVVAKVGTAVGARRWDEARGRVRAALAAALLCGGTATAVC